MAAFCDLHKIDLPPGVLDGRKAVYKHSALMSAYVTWCLQESDLASLPPSQLKEEATHLQQHRLTSSSQNSWKDFGNLTEDEVIDHTLVEVI